MQNRDLAKGVGRERREQENVRKQIREKGERGGKEQENIKEKN